MMIFSKSTTQVVLPETAKVTRHVERCRITALDESMPKKSGITIVCASLINSDSLKISINVRFFYCLGLDLFLFGPNLFAPSTRWS